MVLRRADRCQEPFSRRFKKGIMMRLFVVIFSCLLCIQVINSSFVGECKKGDDCQQNECCAIGMERYSIPQCKPLGREGDWCRIGAEGENRILYYPNGGIREVFDLFILFCPCDKGFHCVNSKCREE